MSSFKATDQKIITKSLKYSVASKFINFDPAKYTSHIIIVDGAPAIHIGKRIYTRLNKD